jgi:hypothetical protein
MGRHPDRRFNAIHGTGTGRQDMGWREHLLPHRPKNHEDGLDVRMDEGAKLTTGTSRWVRTRCRSEGKSSRQRPEWLPHSEGCRQHEGDQVHQTATPNAMPRRGRMDSQGRFWFGEYFGDKIGMFDTTTEKIMEWAPSFKWASPYTASVPDKRGYVYAPSNTGDRVMRLDPKTGEIVEYLMPTRDFDVKQISIDPVRGRDALMANVRNARIVRIEPLD